MNVPAGQRQRVAMPSDELVDAVTVPEGQGEHCVHRFKE